MTTQWRSSLSDVLFGRPLDTSEERGERLGPIAGIPVFGLDALSSAAYGPEAALAVLMVLGSAGSAFIVPITVSITILLAIVFFSYRQTIESYPQGGGSYTVAGENLGPFAGLLAASALMIDYILTAAVGISAGVGALVSAVPSLQRRTLPLCLVILLLITLVNLRGVRETGTLFLIPTYLFLGTLLITLGIGIAKVFAAGGNPTPVISPAMLPPATVGVSAWLMLKAFSSGCTAMTGVEAVSNGITAFREPIAKTAQRTLTVIIAMLIVLLGAIAYLCRAYHIAATNPGIGYESVLSQLTAAVLGRNVFYYVTIGSVLVVLSLSANTAFADFPRLCRLVAQDGYLPAPMAVRGRRLVYTVGILTLATLCAVLLIIFRGITDLLIPLYAVGAFLAFTLSQAGMVAHWKRKGGHGAGVGMVVNGLGAVATAITVGVVTVTKFRDGAWITAVLVPAIMFSMYRIRTHYDSVTSELSDPAPLMPKDAKPPLIVVPMVALNKIVRASLQFAVTLSSEVYAVHVDCAVDQHALLKQWKAVVEEPMKQAGLPAPQLKFLPSPYRFVVSPIVGFVVELEKTCPDRQIAVIVSELVEAHWYQYFLHNQRATWLKAAILRQATDKIVIIDVPWHLS